LLLKSDMQISWNPTVHSFCWWNCHVSAMSHLGFADPWGSLWGHHDRVASGLRPQEARENRGRPGKVLGCAAQLQSILLGYSGLK
jgi:hypothetical protein